jgi:hypothetical protein
MPYCKRLFNPNPRLILHLVVTFTLAMLGASFTSAKSVETLRKDCWAIPRGLPQGLIFCCPLFGSIISALCISTYSLGRSTTGNFGTIMVHLTTPRGSYRNRRRKQPLRVWDCSILLLWKSYDRHSKLYSFDFLEEFLACKVTLKEKSRWCRHDHSLSVTKSPTSDYVVSSYHFHVKRG